MSKIFDRLFFIGPMSLGDAFVSSGIANYYADRCIELHYPTLPKYYETLNTLFQDHPNIKVIPIDGPEHETQYIKNNQLARILRIASEIHFIKNYDIVPMWDVQLYSSYGIEFSLRYSNFRLPKHIEGSEELYQELSQGEPYALVHRYTNDHPSGIPINIPNLRLKQNLSPIKIIEIEEGMTNNMMQYTKLIQNAQEIHVVPSSFHCLVDSIDTKATLYFHDVREKTSMSINSPWNNKTWYTVYYGQRF
jgi:hypothetical protein